MSGGVEVASTNSCDADSSTTVRVVVIAISRLLCGRCGSGGRLVEPVLEAGPGDAAVAAGRERVVVEPRAEVAGPNVGHHAAGIVVGDEQASRELVETEALGTCQLHDAVDGHAHSDVGQRCGDVVRRLRLD